MFKNIIVGLVAKAKQDPVLCLLLISAACFFILYYVTNPIRPELALPNLMHHGLVKSDFAGWYTFYDQGQYLRLAHTLAKLDFHELHTTYSYGLGYPIVAVPAIWLGFSKDPFVFFNLAAFIFTIYATYQTAKKLISPTAGFVAGFGLLFATPLIKYTDQPWNSTVCLVVISSILLTLTKKEIRQRHIFGLGLLLAWAFSARYVDILFLGPLALASIYRGSYKALYRQVVVMALGASIIVLPVLYSHYRVFGSPFRTPYVNHLGIGGVDGSDQGLKAYNIKRAPRAALALFVSPRLAGSPDGDRGLLIDFFWALAAIPGVVLLIRRKNNKEFFYTLLVVGVLSCTFYLSFRASTPGSLKYGELHYFKMYWPALAIMASVYVDSLFTVRKPQKALFKKHR